MMILPTSILITLMPVTVSPPFLLCLATYPSSAIVIVAVAFAGVAVGG